jgi:AmmeMemoRadiSam system protein A
MTPLTSDEKRYLLALARTAMEAELCGASAPAGVDAPRSLDVHAGAFVSLHIGDDLRGCVGYIEPAWPLPLTIARAGAAVTHDDRFPRLRPPELPRVCVEVSVLSPPAPLLAAAVEVGVHGLILSCAGRSGLLLPQVPVEWGWDRETFLDQLCRKAGLPAGTWRERAAELRGFTADRFAEGDRP